MIENDRLQSAIELIAKSNTILITTHTRPDGDACGCMVALDQALTSLGKSVKLILLSQAPQWYDFLFAEKVPILGQDVTVDQLNQGHFAQTDLVMVVDTNSNSQLPEFDQYLKQNKKPVIVFDHHVTADGLGDVELVDTTAAATGLVVLDLFKHAKWPVTEKIAQALFVAVATDTGWFQFSNTDSRTHAACAELVTAGANPTQLYHDLYQSFSLSRFKLMVAMLNTLELHFDGRYAAQHLTLDDFEQTGAAHKDTENLIDQCRRIGSVEVAALFVELNDGRIRCSLRSRGAVDVRLIAQKFGGGGHKMAAGTYLPAPLEHAKQLISTEIEKQFA